MPHPSPSQCFFSGLGGHNNGNRSLKGNERKNRKSRGERNHGKPHEETHHQSTRLAKTQALRFHVCNTSTPCSCPQSLGIRISRDFNNPVNFGGSILQCVCMYIYIYIYIYHCCSWVSPFSLAPPAPSARPRHIYIYIYIYIERERDVRVCIHTCICIHEYIYIYTHTYT